MILGWILALSQDLFERDAAAKRRLSPAPDLGGELRIRAGFRMPGLPDPGCGGFDLRKSYQNLFSKNVREEYLDGLEASLQADLATSPMVLACYASPTVCDTIKHYRASAGAMLGVELEGCRSIESSVGGVDRETKARAVQECMDREAAMGTPIDEAREKCQGASSFRGVYGQRTTQVDVKRDLGLEGDLVGDVRIGAGTLASEENGSSVTDEYERLRRARLDAWRSALADPSPSTAAALGPVSAAELERLAALDGARREAAIRSIAAAQALADLVREIHEAERRLEAAGLNATPEVRTELEKRRDRLRHELARLVERFEAERRVAAAVGEAQALAGEAVGRLARERLAPRRAEEVRRREDEQTKPWGCETKRDERRTP